MQELNNRTIRDIALEAPLTTRVFEEFKIDYCCGGRVPFEEACQKAGVDPSVLTQKLQTLMTEQSAAETPYGDFKTAGELIDHIVSKHHVFTRDEITRLLPLMEKVETRHGENHPELRDIREAFQELAEELLVHMRKEEAVLFPYIEQVEAASTGRLPIPLAHFGTVKNPVRMMMFEHDKAGDLLKKMRELSRDYTAPADSCPSYKGLYAGLADLERDLHQHIHLENNILFPQAIDMEGSVLEG